VKIFPFILLLIVTTQIAMPCCTGSEACSDQTSEESQLPQDSHDCEYSCTGLCCGISFTIESNGFTLGLTKTQKHNYSFDYHFDYSFDYLNRTWHPPTNC